MTLSEFAGLERVAPSIEATRLMDAATAALYPTVKAQDARRLWQHWERMSQPPPPPQPRTAQRSLFSWNGTPVTSVDLKRRLSGHLGAGLSA